MVPEIPDRLAVEFDVRKNRRGYYNQHLNPESIEWGRIWNAAAAGKLGDALKVWREASGNMVDCNFPISKTRLTDAAITNMCYGDSDSLHAMEIALCDTLKDVGVEFATTAAAA